MAGSHHNSVEIDSVVSYPADQFRFFCQKWTGTIARVVPGYGGRSTRAYSGDDTRFDRQYLGRALCHDIGACLDGPHGSMNQPEQGIRLLNELFDFGFFAEADLEFLPYWRTKGQVRYGKDYGDREFDVLHEPPDIRVYVSAYRRPYQRDGRKGYQVLFIAMNEADEPVRANLHLLDSEPFFGQGGRNQLTLAEAGQATRPEDRALAAAVEQWRAGQDGAQSALLDVESGHHVLRQPGRGETYGPLYIPSHEYRILWAYYLPDA
jgi:hypothetical protein